MDFRAVVLKNPGYERGDRVPLLLRCQEGGTLVGRQDVSQQIKFIYYRRFAAN